jgi:hypothetical protein
MNENKISAYVNFDEATRSDTAKRLGLSNMPNEDQIDRMKFVCINIFDKAREHFAKPMYVTSCFRSEAVNKAVGGQPNSQHLRGEAIDIDCNVFGGLTNLQLFEFIRDNLDFDQLLMEGGSGGWIHVSDKPYGNRKSVGEILHP